MSVGLFSSDYPSFQATYAKLFGTQGAIIVASTGRIAAVSRDGSLALATVFLSTGLPSTLSTDFPGTIYTENTIYVNQGFTLG